MFITMFTSALTCAAVPAGADVTARDAERFHQRLDLLIDLFAAAQHQVESAVACLRDAARHARFQAAGSGRFRQRLDFDVSFRRDGRAVDEHLALGARQETVAVLAVDVAHRVVVGDHRDDDVRRRRDPGETVRSLASQLTGQRRGQIGLHVVNGRYRISLVVQVTGHVRAHPTHAYETYSYFHGRHR